VFLIPKPNKELPNLFCRITFVNNAINQAIIKIANCQHFFLSDNLFVLRQHRLKIVLAVYFKMQNHILAQVVSEIILEILESISINCQHVPLLKIRFRIGNCRM
jgi:hypothetical protein